LNYYVYYKVDVERLPALRLSVEELFRTVKAKFKIQGKWLRRRDDPSTYMEVYEGVGDAAAFDAFLEKEARAMGVERRVERFISAETPA
jgi:hypothetical protein